MTCSSVLNIDQTPAELAELYGERDYYAYLRSEPFRKAFLRPIAAIVNDFGGAVLDVACGEACLADYVTVPYAGFDGSATAIERATARLTGSASVHCVMVGRFEAPPAWLDAMAPFQTLVMGGLLEVLVAPDARVPLIEMYVQRFGVRSLIVYDLERLDMTAIDQRFGRPTGRMRDSISKRDALTLGIVDAKRHRKVMVYRVDS